ncbi:MAG TPA: zinc-binding dehydrogenase [Acidimicrobiales bacterium]
MHAIRQHEFGPPEVLRYEEVEDPLPGPGQVRIAVTAAGIHLLDTKIRAGQSGGPFPPPELPMIPGREVAGVVESTGPGVDESWLGRRVVAHLGEASGGYAELAVRDVSFLHAVPDGVSDEAAVAMIGTGRTALGILDVAQLTADDVAIVTAAAGGLGTLLVQAARHAGAVVVGVAGGPAKVEKVRQLGADVAVDYRAPEWTDEVRRALGDREPTVVFDGVGGDLGLGARQLLGFGGRVILYGSSSGSPAPLSAEDLFAQGLTVSAGVGARILKGPGGLRPYEERALAAAADGTLVPLVGQSFPLEKAAEAHRAVEDRNTMGKTVLVP